MDDPKAALPATLSTVPDTSILGTALSSLSITDESPNSSPGTDYQVFLLAGFGHNLYPLTEPDNYPKALLPIANTPLLFYPLQWCNQAGFPSVTVVCHKESEEKIVAYVLTLSWNMQISVEAPSSLEDDLGSADVLSLLAENIVRDFIVLSCDTYTTLPPSELLSFHTSQDPACTAVFFDTSTNEELANLKLKENENSLYVGYEKEKNRLLYLKQAIDVHASLDIRTSLLWRYPRMHLSSTLQDAHIYIFKRWVIDILSREPKISSLRTDLLPVLSKMQWQSNLRKQLQVQNFLPGPRASTHTSLDPSLVPENLKVDSPFKISLYIPSANQYTLRANSLPTYILLNQYLALLAPDPKKHPSSKAGSKTSVGNDAVVAENCSLGEKVQIRKSVLAKGVFVGSRTVIRGSVVMEGVEIGEGVKMEGCVVCKGAMIGSKSSLSDCFVGAGYVVEEGSKVSKQNLVELDELDDDDDDEVEQENDDDEE